MLLWVLVGERSNIALNLVSRKGVEWCFVCRPKFTYSHSRVNRCIFMVEQLFCQITHFWPFFSLNWPKWNFQCVSIFTDNDSSILEAEFLHSIHIYIPFALQMSHSLYLYQRSLHFWIWKTTQKLLSFQFSTLQNDFKCF